MTLLIVSGLSGSGKSIALQALEDLGYYCIDNLPAVLLPHFTEKLLSDLNQEHTHAAVSIDSRSRNFLQSLPINLEALETLGQEYRIIFLEADEAILIKRYSETRRKHPLTDHNTPLIEGIRSEKVLLAPLSDRADQLIDTTYTTPHELRAMVRDYAGRTDTESLSLLFKSFGYKHGTPLDADFVFDVRCLPNPYWQPDLKDLSGLQSAVVEFLEQQPSVHEMVAHIRDFIETWLPSFREENRSYITVAIGCTGGRHRSVYITQKLAEHFSKQLNVHIRHRELS
ncbi:MAG: RNase adapter RapZ [Gammaproteobacteria bacterium]|nr:RNase adapter RapZ [Gammaproteobacteria bacterium]